MYSLFDDSMRLGFSRHVFGRDLFSWFTKRRELEGDREKRIVFEIISNSGPRGIHLDILVVKLHRIPEERIKEHLSQLQYEGTIHDENGRLKLGTRLGPLQN